MRFIAYLVSLIVLFGACSVAPPDDTNTSNGGPHDDGGTGGADAALQDAAPMACPADSVPVFPVPGCGSDCCACVDPATGGCVCYSGQCPDAGP